MTPFHYTIVQCRDFAVVGERRNVGLLVAAPALRKLWLRRGDLRLRAHLIGDEGAMVRALLDAVEAEAAELVRDGQPAAVHAWMRARALPSEDVLSFAPPAVGVATDLKGEVDRLALAYLGKPPARGTKAADVLVAQVLKEAGWAARFAPRALPCGPATWRFPRVAGDAGAPTVVNALTFDQTTPEGLLDAAFHNIGRAGEVQVHHPGARWVTVAVAPRGDGPAFRRACDLMAGAGLGLVAPEPSALREALQARLGAAPRAERATA